MLSAQRRSVFAELYTGTIILTLTDIKPIHPFYFLKNKYFGLRVQINFFIFSFLPELFLKCYDDFLKFLTFYAFL